MAQSIALPTLTRGEWLPMSAEEFDAWVPDGMRAEWVDGRGIVFVTTNARHVRAFGFLVALLTSFTGLTGLGEVFPAPFQMRLEGGRSRREPDIMVVQTENLHRVERRWLSGPADFAAEFVSPNSVQEDLVVKRHEFEAGGVTEYLPIDMREGEERFTFLRRDGEGRYQDVQPDAEGRYHSQVLPGFWLKASWFWQDPLPRPEHLLLQIAPDLYLRDLIAADRAWRADRD